MVVTNALSGHRYSACKQPLTLQLARAHNVVTLLLLYYISIFLGVAVVLCKCFQQEANCRLFIITL